MFSSEPIHQGKSPRRSSAVTSSRRGFFCKGFAHRFRGATMDHETHATATCRAFPRRGHIDGGQTVGLGSLNILYQVPQATRQAAFFTSAPSRSPSWPTPPLHFAKGHAGWKPSPIQFLQEPLEAPSKTSSRHIRWIPGHSSHVEGSARVDVCNGKALWSCQLGIRVAFCRTVARSPRLE